MSFSKAVGLVLGGVGMLCACSSSPTGSDAGRGGAGGGAGAADGSGHAGAAGDSGVAGHAGSSGGALGGGGSAAGGPAGGSAGGAGAGGASGAAGAPVGGAGAGGASTGGAGAGGAAGAGHADAGTDAHKDAGTPDAAAAPVTIYTIVLSQTDYAEIVGNSAAPYLNGLIAANGLATNYLDVSHPTVPNRLEMISGSTQYPGLLDVGPISVPYFPSSAMDLGAQMTAAGISWRAYAEAMGSTCNLAASGAYNPMRVPFLYFSATEGKLTVCNARIVDLSLLADDLSTGTSRYLWISPSTAHDGTSQGLAAADTWLSTVVPMILAAPAYRANGVLFITVDEAVGRNGDSADQIPMIVVSPRIKAAGYESAAAFTHASYLATVEDLLGLPRLADAATAQTLTGFLK